MPLPDLTDLANKPKLARSHKNDRLKHLRSVEDLFGSSKPKAAHKDKRGRPWARNPKEFVSKDDEENEDEEDFSSNDSESENEASMDEEEYEADELEDKDFLTLVKDAPTVDEATKRIAVLHFDWDNTKVEDIFILLDSFVPKDGKLIKVTIFPSNFGIEKIEEENTNGPSELKTASDEIKSKFKNHEDQIYDLDDKKNWRHIPKELKLKIRNYQLSRLKYFYAIAEFDSAETANKVYESCDGFEYQNSGVSLDLRFVPDSEVFEVDEKYAGMVSECSSLNKAKYLPKRFVNDALHSTRVELTWDKTPSYRTQWMKSQFSEEADPKKTLEEDREELEQYVAFSSSGASTCASSDVDEPGPAPTVPRIRKHRPPKVPIEKARALLFGCESKSENEESDQESEEEEEYDLDDQEKESEEDEEYEKMDDTPTNDPFAVFDQDSPVEFADHGSDSDEERVPAKKKLKKTDEDDGSSKKKKISRRKKIKEKLKKSKESRKNKCERERELWFNTDDQQNLVQDSRFDEMLTNPNFKIEQTHPQYETAKTFNEFIKVKKEKLK